MTKMKLNKEHIDLLANLLNVNHSAHFTKGSVVRVKSNSSRVMVEVETGLDFPYDFSIHDMPIFISLLKTFKEPILEFSDNETYVDIFSPDMGLVQYFFADKLTVERSVVPPETDLGIYVDSQEPVAVFDITSDIYKKLMSTSSLLNLSYMTVTGNSERVKLQAKGNVNNYSVVVPGKAEEGVVVSIELDMLNITNNRDFVVRIAEKGDIYICEFRTDNITYWVVGEKENE